MTPLDIQGLLATRFSIGVAACLFAASAGAQAFERLYQQNCAVCHGESFQGAAQGTALVGAPLIRGEGVDAIAKSIAEGAPDLGMPAWSATLGEAQIRSLAILIAEERANATFADFRMEPPLAIPDAAIETKAHAFRLTTVVDGLEPLPYSIAPLPDGRILLTEKMRGLTVVSADGTQSELIEGAPIGNREAFQLGPLHYGLGWILDVAPHPDFANNGWIYLSYGDRCVDCTAGERIGLDDQAHPRPDSRTVPGWTRRPSTKPIRNTTTPLPTWPPAGGSRSIGPGTCSSV